MSSDPIAILPEDATPRPSVAVSACLLGHAVRYDGTDKAHEALARYILPHVEVLPLCPEAGAGLGVPRPPVQLVATGDGVQALGRDELELDVTIALREFAERQAAILATLPGLCGHVLKSRSPSCGLSSTPVHDAQRRVVATGSGIYAQHIARALPWLVLIEESALEDEHHCRQFLQQLRFVQRVRSAAEQQALADFHKQYCLNRFNTSLEPMLELLIAANNWQQYLLLLRPNLPSSRFSPY